MEESKLTMQQRQKVNHALRAGRSLPILNENSSKKYTRALQREIKEVTRPSSPKRRMFNTIVKSGAYEREKYIPKHPIQDRNRSIEHLQNLMYYGKDVKPKNDAIKKKKTPNVPKEDVTFEILQNEVEDRQNWLVEMEKLGEGEKYRPIITQQIATILRQMEQLNISTN